MTVFQTLEVIAGALAVHVFVIGCTERGPLAWILKRFHIESGGAQ